MGSITLEMRETQAAITDAKLATLATYESALAEVENLTDKLKACYDRRLQLIEGFVDDWQQAEWRLKIDRNVHPEAPVTDPGGQPIPDVVPQELTGETKIKPSSAVVETPGYEPPTKAPNEPIPPPAQEPPAA